MAYRLITQVVIVGARIVGRSFAAAYKQAQASSQYARAQAKLNPDAANRAGGARANLSAGMTLQEACKILNIKPPTGGQGNAEEVAERFKRLFDANDPKKGGSFYLQSKVVRAKERLDAELGRVAERVEAENAAKEGFNPKIYKDR
ncbi:hypothetical protein VUR80DRAFT_519 [Thermomyces stellatus]